MFGTKTNAFEALVNREIELTTRKENAVQALKGAEAAAATALLESDAVTETDVVHRLRVEIDTIDEAVRMLRSNRLQAIRSDRERQASEIRGAAAKQQAELDALNAKTAKALATLSEIQGVPFSPAILEWEPFTGPNAGPNSRWQCRSAIMSREISDANLRADKLQNDPIAKSGAVDEENVVNVMGVIQKALSHSSDSPSAADIHAWYTAVISLARRHGRYSDDLPRRICLAWSGGKIDNENSSVFIPALARQIEPTQHSGWAGPIADNRSATFQTAA